MVDVPITQSFARPPRFLKRRFTAAEDAAIQHLVNTLGDNKWEEIGQLIPARSARQCRERYEHYLAESLSTCPWTKEDDDRLIRIANEYGHRWTEMTKHFPGRNPNNLKNRWHKGLSKTGSGPWKLPVGTENPGQLDNIRDFPEVSDGIWCTTEELAFHWPADEMFVS
jgi:hypothetical protein